MKQTIKLFIIIFFILSSTIVNAHHLDVKLNDQVFQPGKTIILNATVENTKNKVITLKVEAILQDKNMKATPFPVSFQVELQPYANKTLTIFDLIVDDRFYNGFYTIQISLIEDQFRVIEKEIDFEITGSQEDMDLDIIIANDPGFSTPLKVFVKNEKIYIKISCAAENSVYTATLTKPDNTITQINIPAELTAENVGSYKITVQAQADGYRKTSIIEYFAVIEHEPFQQANNYELIIIAIVIVIIIIIVFD